MIPFGRLATLNLDAGTTGGYSARSTSKPHERGFMTTTKLFLTELLKPYGDCEITMRVFNPEEQDYQDVEICGIRVVISENGSAVHVDVLGDQ